MDLNELRRQAIWEAQHTKSPHVILGWEGANGPQFTVKNLEGLYFSNDVFLEYYYNPRTDPKHSLEATHG